MSKANNEADNKRKHTSSKDTELYRKTENIQQRLDRLRDAYITYKESAGRCKLELRPRRLPSTAQQLGAARGNKEDQEFRNFYLPPRIPQLEEPERQKKFRNEYIAEVGARPEPAPLVLLADNLHLEALQTIADRSKPSVAREDLAAFYRRHAVSLQHKKYKLLGRWANQLARSEQVDAAGPHFDRMVGRLQQELDAALGRSERLAVDDSYDVAVDPGMTRPQPTSSEQNGEGGSTLLYVEAPMKCINSVIRHDDVEVYLRIQTCRHKLFRMPEKLAASIKWLPYSCRFSIWKESRGMIQAAKVAYNEQRRDVLKEVADQVEHRLINAGVADDKLLLLVSDKYTAHLKDEDVSRNQEVLSSHKSTHEKPPFLYTSNVELKSALEPLADEYREQLGGFTDVDDGHQFTYKVKGLWPVEFQRQVLAMQFDWIDSGEGTQADTDILLIQKLTTELGLDKHEMLSQMAKQAEVERNKSILGQIGHDKHQADGAQARPGRAGSSSEQSEDIARANLIRRIKEMKFFSLDETEYKLQQADWLRYVCWQPCVSEVLKRSNNLLSSLDENPIDSLLLSAFEFIDVNESGAANKILEDSATAHVRKVRGYFTDISQKTTKASHADAGAAEEMILRSAAVGESAGQGRNNGQQRPDEPSHYDQAKVEGYLQTIDPLKQHLIKSYYTLRLLKSRSIKAQMIQALNYFRGVQKRLAHDVREFFTRERALGGQKVEEALIGPQFGKDEFGNLKAKKGGSAGPGGINANRLGRELDDAQHRLGPDGERLSDPVSLKGYKYNRRFNPHLSSTCPCVPRFHSTFGRPTLYEEVSEQIENKGQDPGQWRGDSRTIAAYKDRLIFKKSSKGLVNSEITVLDEHGIQIVYEVAINDMLMLEEEMIKIGSFFLNKAELAHHTSASEQPLTMLDRGEVALHLLQHELELQLTKIQLIEALIEVYEHTCDPLESVRLIQIVADTMALRPRVNLEATYFRDSYMSEIEVLKTKLELYREVLDVQRRAEQSENENVRKFQELKLRKLHDFVEGKWQYEHEPKKAERMGTKEEQAKGQGQEQTRQGKRAQHLKEMQRQLALKEIAERHITEFAGDQHTDFANVLGLPEVTASDLFKKQGQQDPIVVDAIREHSHFSKQIEGYPWFFTRTEGSEHSLGLHTDGCGLTDFFESLCAITRIHAACEQAFAELSQVHRPENGLASSCLEKAMLAEARGRLGVLRQQSEEGMLLAMQSKCINHLEEDFYLSSSDKLVFLMREFKSDLHPDQIAQQASPLLVAKLAVSEIAKYDFPRLKLAEIEDGQELNDEQLTEKMINMAKVSISRKHGDDQVKDSSKQDEAGRESDDERQDASKIQSPSMLVLACNIVEVLRLRSELIKIVHENDELAEVYRDQLKATNKQVKLVQADAIPFATQSITKDNMNLVDYNDGSKLQLDLAMREFDATLGASLDFRSESCIKALMTDLGVEELRAVVHYQLMQKQLLAVAVMRNQALMDGPQQGLVELELLARSKNPIAVPGAMVNLKDVLSRAVDGVNQEQIKRETVRLQSNLTKEIGEHMYSIAELKSRYKPAVSKKYGQVFQRVVGTSYCAEAKLRILRSYRLRLLHEFCQDVLKEAYSDSVSIQTLLACRELRRRSQLFPQDPQVFTVKILENFQEHLPRALSDSIDQNQGFVAVEDRASLEQILQGRPKTLFYIPSSSEIMTSLIPKGSDAQTAILQGKLGQNVEQFDVAKVDGLIHSLVKPASLYLPTESQTQPQNRLVTFREAYNYESTQTELYQFFSLILQIVSLEYLMGRNNAPGTQIMELEDKVLSGRPFWGQETEKQSTDPDPESLRHAPERVITKIMSQKRARVDLAEDLAQISRRLARTNEFLKSSNASHLHHFLDLLRLQHQSSYLHFMNGLENALDIYLDHKSDENFAKVQEALNCLAKRDHGFNLLGNGLYLSQGSREAIQIDSTSAILQDHDQFNHCYQPIVDESALVPPQLALVRRLYGRAAQREMRAPAGLLSLAMPDYHEMNCSFLNMDDEQRAFIATNFYQLDEGVNEYLVFQGLVPDSSGQRDDKNQASKSGAQAVSISRPKDILPAKVEYLGRKVEARHLQRVLMSWATCSALPADTEGYQRAQTLYREQTMLKVLLERDLLTEQYYEAKERHRDGSEGNSLAAQAKKLKKERATILESVNPSSREHTVVSRLHQTKAEIAVAHRVLHVEMIQMSLTMIEREHASLLAAFEQGAADWRVHAFVHPQQQFASTLFQSVDTESHLDVVNKLGFVQSFLTKLRNRCTEVETLASGPGIVFSMKDFNECLQVFCQGLLKYGEVQFRSRIETQHIRQNQYQHLLYMKEKQALYYRRKCEQFLGDIDKLVNSKISQKGSQLIYELDVASRELRVLRDNYRLMQTMMMEELRNKYRRTIQEKRDQLSQLREQYSEHRERVSQTTTADVAQRFQVLTDKVSELCRPNEDGDGTNIGAGGRALPSGLGGNLPRNAANQPAAGYALSETSGGRGQPSRIMFDAEPLREVLGLQSYIRKYKILTMMKSVLAQEQHEKELANQRAQLTSNAALWDQLAEAEKREQITKQELSLTKLSLASYEKLIEKLQGQLENLNNQKNRLQQYKNSKSKRIDELENKMKDLEILENIDLNRILSELKSRDRKITALDAENQAQKDELTYVVHQQHKTETGGLKKRLGKERELKLQAYDRLEGLRVEMRALEGKDMKSDLWKDKCRELFDICKDLERENDDLKALVRDANQAHLLSAAEDLERNQGLGLMAGQLPEAYLLDQNKSEGPLSHGARSNLVGHGGRLVSSRTLAAGAAAKYNGRLGSGVGLGHPGDLLGGQSQPSVVFGGGDFDGASSQYGHLRKSGAGPQQSHFHPTQQETLHSENYQSNQYSAHQGLHNQFAEAQEMLSLGSGGVIGDTLNSGLLGAGGVFGAPLQGLQPSRGIMTAGGGQRPLNTLHRVDGLGNRTGYAAGAKRLQTSHGPNAGQGDAANGKLPVRSIQSRHLGKSGGRPQPGSLQPKSRVHYASQNHDGLAMAGMNIQNRVAPGGVEGQRYGVARVAPGRPGLSQKPASLGNVGLGGVGGVPPHQPNQPVNVSINFNTTNINLKK